MSTAAHNRIYRDLAAEREAYRIRCHAEALASRNGYDESKPTPTTAEFERDSKVRTWEPRTLSQGGKLVSLCLELQHASGARFLVTWFPAKNDYEAWCSDGYWHWASTAIATAMNMIGRKMAKAA